MHERLFEPRGMISATPRFDTSGTFIGSSFLLATPEDFARFGYLYLRGGRWENEQILPTGWVDYARTPTFNDGVDAYGAHWSIVPHHPASFFASGYDGQRIFVLPDKDTIIVRCGRTPDDGATYLWERIDEIAAMLQ